MSLLALGNEMMSIFPILFWCLGLKKTAKSDIVFLWLTRAALPSVCSSVYVHLDKFHVFSNTVHTILSTYCT